MTGLRRCIFLIAISLGAVSVAAQEAAEFIERIEGTQTVSN